LEQEKSNDVILVFSIAACPAQFGGNKKRQTGGSLPNSWREVNLCVNCLMGYLKQRSKYTSRFV